MNAPLLTLEIRLEPDIVLTRQRARQIALLLGFPMLDQTRVATAASEIARSAFEYAGGGRVEFLVESGPPPCLLIRVRPRGPGVRDLPAILEGRAGPVPGVGPELLGARRLMDRFEIEPDRGGGVTVAMAKSLPRRTAAFTPQDLARVSAELARNAPSGLLEELQQQNQELLRTLQELRERQAELAQLHARELEETNRGVVALYAELDENAKALRRISELKSRFLSNMSHEFRSPLNSIASLTGFLLERSDGDLSPEQEKQVRFIRKAAEGLSVLVNDLLDLAKVEAGKAVVRPEAFEAADLFEALRESVGPLLGPAPVTLRFEEPRGIPELQTDQGKLAQILRNFLTNAVKFTERGEIRVAAAPGPGDTVIFSVADTGIGIAPGDRGRIFEEFGQIEGPLQGRVKGTGLGLPLSRKLAELLGGAVSVRSEPGVGSTFFVVVPRRFRDPGESESAAEARWRLDPERRPVLVVDDDPVDLLLCEKYLEGSPFQVLAARTLDEARRVLKRVRPLAVLLDVHTDAEAGWTFLVELKAGDDTRDVAVVVLSTADGEERALALGADGFRPKPADRGWLLAELRALDARRHAGTVLIVDDEESHRYMLRESLSGQGRYVIIEAVDGEDGLRRAREDRPSVIFLDLVMPDMTGFEVLDRLKSDPATAGIPVIIRTSRLLEAEEQARLSEAAAAIVSKAAGTQDEECETIRRALARAGLDPTERRAES